MTQEPNGEKIETPDDSVERLRRRNLRQLLLRVSRRVNREIVEGLRRRGHTFLNAAHTTLLSNIDMAGGTTTEIAERAGITKQAMGRLATQLIEGGYLEASGVPGDKRAKRLTFTEEGRALMRDSFEVMRELERDYAERVGEEDFLGMLRSLTALAES